MTAHSRLMREARSEGAVKWQVSVPVLCQMSSCGSPLPSIHSRLKMSDMMAAT